MATEENASRGGSSMEDAQRTMAAIEGVVRILGPLTSEDRQRVIQGALVVLREQILPQAPSHFEKRSDQASGVIDLPPRARLWVKQNGLSDDQLLHVFDFSDGVATVIAPGISGKSGAVRTIKSYVLTGIAAFLSSGEPVFLDKDARALCEHFGCYDSTNHSKYMKEKENYFVGGKDQGWKLTAPGLKFGASVVKDLLGE